MNFFIKKIRNTVSWTCAIRDFNSKEIFKKIFQNCYEKEKKKIKLKKKRQNEKVTSKKDNKLFVKQRSYNNSFSNQINKKDLL